MNKKGFAPLLIVVIVVVMLGVGGGIYFGQKMKGGFSDEEDNVIYNSTSGNKINNTNSNSNTMPRPNTETSKQANLPDKINAVTLLKIAPVFLDEQMYFDVIVISQNSEFRGTKIYSNMQNTISVLKKGGYPGAPVSKPEGEIISFLYPVAVTTANKNDVIAKAAMNNPVSIYSKSGLPTVFDKFTDAFYADVRYSENQKIVEASKLAKSGNQLIATTNVVGKTMIDNLKAYEETYWENKLKSNWKGKGSVSISVNYEDNIVVIESVSDFSGNNIDI